MLAASTPRSTPAVFTICFKAPVMSAMSGPTFSETCTSSLWTVVSAIVLSPVPLYCGLS